MRNSIQSKKWSDKKLEKDIKSICSKWPVGKKHKWKQIEELPNQYLRWVAENFNEKTPFSKALCIAADRELQYRIKHNIVVEE